MSDNKRGPYPASLADPKLKGFAINLYPFLKAESGMKKRRFLELCSEAGLDISRGTLNRGLCRLNADEPIYIEEKKSGKKARLSIQELNVLAGWIALKNLSPGQVTLQGVLVKIHELFDVEVKKSTACKYLKQLGCHSIKLKLGNSVKALSDDEMEEMIMGWVKKERNAGGVLVLHIRSRSPDAVLVCIDFTYTSHFTDSRRGYAADSGSRPRVDSNKSQYTNCIVTAVFSDGVVRWPSVLFTFNPAFQQKSISGKIYEQRLKRLHAEQESTGIEGKRIKYLGDDKNEKRTFTKEMREYMEKFHQIFPVEAVGCPVYVVTDNGSAFKKHGQPWLTELGYSKHEFLPASVHQLMSMCDNNLHGSAKALWKNQGLDMKDDVHSTLQLMLLLDEQNRLHGKEWFQRNMGNVTRRTVHRLIGHQKDVTKERIAA